MAEIRRWWKIRKLSRHQERCWPEASYINGLYTWLRIVTDFKEGLEAIRHRSSPAPKPNHQGGISDR
jgi:hypothetical protein